LGIVSLERCLKGVERERERDCVCEARTELLAGDHMRKWEENHTATLHMVTATTEAAAAVAVALQIGEGEEGPPAK
jgi:hypothetical protein